MYIVTYIGATKGGELEYSDDRLVIFAGCAAAVLHVAVTRAIAYAVRKPEASFSAGLLVLGSAVGVISFSTACVFAPPAVGCSTSPHSSLTISRVVSTSPYCASFAVGLSMCAFGIRRALRKAGDGSLAPSVSILIFAAFPSVQHIAIVHNLCIFAIAASCAYVAYNARFGKELGRAAVAVHRMHFIGASTCGIVSMFLAYYTDYRPSRNYKLFTIIFEVAAVTHSAAAFT